MCLLRIHLPNLCPNMNHFWRSGFQWMSLWRSDKFLLTLGVQGSEERFAVYSNRITTVAYQGNMCNYILMEAIFTKGFDKIAAAKEFFISLGWKAEISPTLIRLALHMESPTHPDKGMRESHLWQEMYSVCSKAGGLEFRISVPLSTSKDVCQFGHSMGILLFFFFLDVVALAGFHIFTKNI